MDRARHATLAGTLYILAAITSWGAYFTFAKLVLAKLTPAVFLIFRLGIGTAALMVLSAWQRRSPAVRRRDLLIVIAAAAVGIVLHQLIQLAGLRFTSATNTGWILTLIPPVTGVLGWVFLGERVSVRQMLGLLVAIAGVTLFVSDGNLGRLSFSHNRGDLLALASVFTWSAYIVITKSRLRLYDPLPISAIQMAAGFLFFLVVAGMDVPAQAAALGKTEWLIVVAIGVIPSGLAYYWWNAGLKRLSAINTSMFLFIEAIVASLTGAIVLGESFSARMLLFTAIVIAGVYLTQFSPRRHVS